MRLINGLTGAFLLLTAVVCGAVTSGTTPLAALPQTTKSLHETPHEVGKVTLDGKPLFEIKAQVLSFSPAERARTVSDRLSRLSAEDIPLAAIVSVDGEASTDILAGDRILMSVTNADAEANGVSRKELANDYATSIRAALADHQLVYSAQSFLLSLVYAGLSTVVLLALLISLKVLSNKLLARIVTWQGTWIRTIRIQSLEILHQERIVGMLVGGLKILRLCLYLIMFYIYLPMVFSFFPATRDYADKLFGYINTPVDKIWHGMIAYIPNIFFILVIVAATHYFLVFVRLFFGEVEKGSIKLSGFHGEWAAPTFNIARFLVIAFSVVIAFPYLPGAESPAFKGVSVFLGVLLSLGSTSAVGNIVSGIIITYMRPFKVGDRVKIAETVGDVREKTLLVTRIRTIKNVDVTIPNALVLGSHITNYSAEAQTSGLILHTTVTIGYDAPWRQVHELLIAAAGATGNILATPAPFVLQTSLDDFYVRYEINAYTDKPSIMAETYSLLHQNIQDRFNAAGVEIMSPHYSQLRDGNESTIPAEFRTGKKSLQGFRIDRSETGTTSM